MDAARRLPGQRVLGDRRFQHRRTCRGRAARCTTSSSPRSRFSSARRCRSRSPAARRAARRSAACSAHAVWRSVALIAARHLPALAERHADVLDLRRHAHADRPRLHVSVPARVRVRCACRSLAFVGHPRRVLDGVRPLSAAAGELRLPERRRPGGLAASLLGIPRALQQELEPLVGVRRLVPEPLPARVAVPIQRRRLVHAQLHPDAGDDDAGPLGRRSG